MRWRWRWQGKGPSDPSRAEARSYRLPDAYQKIPKECRSSLFHPPLYLSLFS